MRKATSAVALLATTAVALAAHGPTAVQAAGKADPGGREIHIMPVNPMVVPDETLDADVAVVEKMSDKDLKDALNKLYTEKMSVFERTTFPRGSIEAMQRRIKDKESKDQEQLLVTNVMNRYALLLGNMLHAYYVYLDVKVEAASTLLSQEEYKEKLKRLQTLADSMERENRLLVAYLRKAAGELRTKSASMTRVQGVVGFITDLAAMYETQQMRLHMEVELAKMRFKEDKAVEFEVLDQDRAYTETESQRSALIAEYNKRAKQAKASATSSVDNGVLAADYLKLVE
ncbi:hypothetical protein Emed_007100 [Eimeria media]